MLKNYLLIATRNLFKNKIFSFLNILGLAIGMAAFLFIIHYVTFERSYESFHKNADNMYRVTLDLYNENEYVVTDCETYPPLAPLLKSTMPEVVDYVRMFHNDGLQDIQVGDKKFLAEGLYFADASIFKVFTLKVLHGDQRTALIIPHSIVLTESLARKYFNKTDAIGESLKVYDQTYQVNAVIADLPQNTHLKFNALMSHATLPVIHQWYKEDSWNGNNEYTYLLMQPGTNLKVFNEKMVAVAKGLKDKIGTERFTAEPIRDIHLYSAKSFEPEVNGSAAIVNVLLIIAIAIIVIAWVNYINLSTARAIERAREVGIRKVMGSVRSQLIIQFLAESVIINMIAGAFAFFMFQTALPIFSTLIDQPMPADLLSDTNFLYTFLGIIFAGALLSGIYPAFVLSSFQPVTVLKGKFRSSAHGQQLRKALVVFQFAATIVLITGMAAVYLQINYLRSQDLGMNLDQTLVVRAPQRYASDSVMQTKYKALTNELLQNTTIQNVARSETVPGLSLHELSTTDNIKRVGKEKEGGSYNYYVSSIDEEFIPTLNMKLTAGKNWEKGLKDSNGVIINEEAVKRLGFADAEEAIGSPITFYDDNNKPCPIMGVVKNFYMQSPKEQQIPMLFYYGKRANYVSVKLKTENMAAAIADVKSEWNKVFPNSLFTYFFLDEKYDQQYQADIRFGTITATFSILAVVIACLGLFGLSAYTIVQRTKEIGIRKVLGASVFQIVHLLSGDFMKVILISAFLGIPLSYVAIDQWLNSYSVRIDLNAWMFMIPVGVILLIALLTVSVQTIQTALENPTNSLKHE